MECSNTTNTREWSLSAVCLDKSVPSPDKCQWDVVNITVRHTHTLEGTRTRTNTQTTKTSYNKGILKLVKVYSKRFIKRFTCLNNTCKNNKNNTRTMMYMLLVISYLFRTTQRQNTHMHTQAREFTSDLFWKQTNKNKNADNGIMDKLVPKKYHESNT